MEGANLHPLHNVFVLLFMLPPPPSCLQLRSSYEVCLDAGFAPPLFHHDGYTLKSLLLCIPVLLEQHLGHLWNFTTHPELVNSSGYTAEALSPWFERSYWQFFANSECFVILFILSMTPCLRELPTRGKTSKLITKGFLCPFKPQTPSSIVSLQYYSTFPSQEMGVYLCLPCPLLLLLTFCKNYLILSLGTMLAQGL